jgi:hypothetical protein
MADLASAPVAQTSSMPAMMLVCPLIRRLSADAVSAALTCVVTGTGKQAGKVLPVCGGFLPLDTLSM